MNDFNDREAESKNRGPGIKRPCTNEARARKHKKVCCKLSAAQLLRQRAATVSSSGAKGREAARPPLSYGRNVGKAGGRRKQTGFPLECLQTGPVSTVVLENILNNLIHGRKCVRLTMISFSFRSKSGPW